MRRITAGHAWIVSCLLAATMIGSYGSGATSQPYEADYSYEIVKKSPDGTVTALDKGKVERAAAGDGGGADVPGVGRVATRIRSLSATGARVEVSLPGDKVVTLDLSPGTAVEQFPADGEIGVRMTLTMIRQR
jgi:hypothetical protein